MSAHHTLLPLSPEAKAARKPLPPADLVGAMHDSIHRDMPGRGRAAKSVKAKGGSR